jgi:molybdopterin converting factor small subunit
MVEIRYGEQYEIADLAGQTVSEVREQFKAEFGIPDRARARLNGIKIKESTELDTVLDENDRLSFTVDKGKSAYLVGALLLALAATGGVFAFGWVNASTTLMASTATQDFAAVSVNNSTPVTWHPYGFYKGSISGGSSGIPIFNVDTLTPNYTGDLVVTVSIANADTLSKCYRTLSLRVMMYDSSNNIVDINENNSGAGDDNDFVLLTLNNGSVDMFPGGAADRFTVRIKSGYYTTHIYEAENWDDASDYQPQLFCEVAQR